MRLAGTVSKWNDDRGFGFIAPAQGGAEIFAHISAFPKDGRRPHVGERVTFEIGTGKDGKKQARNILCPTRPVEKPYRLSEPVRRREGNGLFSRVVPLVLLVALGAYGYDRYTRGAAPVDGTSRSSHALAPAATRDSADSGSFRCDGRTRCSQMTSCAEAKFFLNNCPNVEMDGNHDGQPCEQQWCG